MYISIVRLQKLQRNMNCVVLQYKDGHILNYSVANVCVDWTVSAHIVQINTNTITSLWKLSFITERTQSSVNMNVASQYNSMLHPMPDDNVNSTTNTDDSFVS